MASRIVMQSFGRVTLGTLTVLIAAGALLATATQGCGGARESAEPGASSALGHADLPQDPDYATWVTEQNQRSRALLSTNAALQAAVKARYAELAPGNASVRTDQFGREFFTSKGSLILAGAPDRTLVDAATLGAGAAVTEFRLSPDGAKLAYGFAKFGSDWTTWKVLAMDDLRELAGPFVIKSSGGDNMNWDADSEGLYYANWLTAAEDEVGKRQPQIKYHRLGADADAGSDPIVFEDAELPKTIKYNAQAVDATTAVIYRSIGADVPLAIVVAKKIGNGATGESWQTKPLVTPKDEYGRFLGARGSKIYLRTSAQGGRYGVDAIDVVTEQRTTIVPPHANNVLSVAQLIGERLVLQYLSPTLETSAEVFDLAGVKKAEFRPADHAMPTQGTLGAVTGGDGSRFGYFTYQTGTTPPETFKLDTLGDVIQRLPGKSVPFDGSKVKVEFRSYPSADGASVPIWVFSRADAPAPPSWAYLYVYGNIGALNGPQFNRKFQLMLEMGGAVALAAIRGGGEFGLDWQLPGTFDKWTSFNDIVAASRFLKTQYPSVTDRVVLSGRSYGGMMTMGAYVHFPDEFKVFTPVVSVSSVPAQLEKERGWVYFDDMGFRRDDRGFVIHDKKHYAALEAWSPLENVGKLTPARTKPMMAFAAQYDARVSSQHTGRFVKAVQGLAGTTAPVYLLEHENVGHNGRAEAVDEALFVASQLGLAEIAPIKPPQP